MRRKLTMAGIAALLALPAVALAAPPTEIKVNDDFFNPARPATRNFSGGSTFHWSRAVGSGGEHNVRQDARLFRSGGPTFGPIDYAVDASAGKYHYYCEVHGFPGGGMDGVIKVRPSFDPVPSGRPFTVIWASSGTDTGEAFDVRFKRGSGDWRIWRNDTTRFQAVFGNHRRPVRVRLNQVYKFQVRSEKASNHSRRSDWSPTLRVAT